MSRFVELEKVHIDETFHLSGLGLSKRHLNQVLGVGFLKSRASHSCSIIAAPTTLAVAACLLFTTKLHFCSLAHIFGECIPSNRYHENV